jgi:hypothetical protein
MLLFAAPAAAQTAPERTSLQREIGRHRQVTIEFDAPGDAVVGRIQSIDRDSIEVALASGPRRIRFADVRRISREGDSVGNCALIGMTVLGTWCAIICGQGLNAGGQVVLAVLVNGSVGAGIGALIDASHNGRTTLYRRRTGVRVRATASPRAVGVSATLKW